MQTFSIQQAATLTTVRLCVGERECGKIFSLNLNVEKEGFVFLMNGFFLAMNEKFWGLSSKPISVLTDFIFDEIEKRELKPFQKYLF